MRLRIVSVILVWLLLVGFSTAQDAPPNDPTVPVFEVEGYQPEVPGEQIEPVAEGAQADIPIFVLPPERFFDFRQTTGATELRAAPFVGDGNVLVTLPDRAGLHYIGDSTEPGWIDVKWHIYRGYVLETDTQTNPNRENLYTVDPLWHTLFRDQLIKDMTIRMYYGLDSTIIDTITIKNFRADDVINRAGSLLTRDVWCGYGVRQYTMLDSLWGYCHSGLWDANQHRLQIRFTIADNQFANPDGSWHREYDEFTYIEVWQDRNSGELIVSPFQSLAPFCDASGNHCAAHSRGIFALDMEFDTFLLYLLGLGDPVYGGGVDLVSR